MTMKNRLYDLDNLTHFSSCHITIPRLMIAVFHPFMVWFILLPYRYLLLIPTLALHHSQDFITHSVLINLILLLLVQQEE